jgi:MFS family permease
MSILFLPHLQSAGLNPLSPRKKLIHSTGVFVSNVDSSLVLATNSTISSTFHRLEAASWLTTAYMMAMCAAQPIVGKLSDVYGRKNVLLTCYTLFAVGTVIIGFGQAMWHVIGGRVVAGLGGAGMSVIVSVLIADLVPLRDVAPWRSYVNIVATTGRMIGGPLGGWLADTIGWRWSFLAQVPLTILAIMIVSWTLEHRPQKVATQNETSEEEEEAPPAHSKLSRVDFVGSALLVSVIISFLFAVEEVGKDLILKNAALILTIVGSVVLALIFIGYELKVAQEPVFPPRILLQRDVATSYLICLLQSGAQLALMFSVPLYFQVVSNASDTVAGSRLVPAFVGNTFGSLGAGFFIKKTGRYKKLTILSSLIGTGTYLTIILRWHGPISIWETLEIFPGGFAAGVALASTFIVLTAKMPHEAVAVATGGLYLASNLGVVLGLSISSGLQRGVLKYLLKERLPEKIQEKVYSVE